MGRTLFAVFPYASRSRFYSMLHALLVLRSRPNCVGGCSLLFVASRPKAGPPTSRPGGPLLKRSAPRRVTMPAIASLEDLKAAQKEGVSIYAMLYAVCWLWLQERTPEEVKGERG